MKRNGGVVNGLTFNAQLTVKLSVFSRLQSLINQSSGFCGRASGRCPSSRFVEVRKHLLALMLRRPAGSRRNEPALRRSASPVYQSHPSAWPMDRSFISEPVRRLGRPIAHRAPGRRTVAIPVGEQLNLLQSVSCRSIGPPNLWIGRALPQSTRKVTHYV